AIALGARGNMEFVRQLASDRGLNLADKITAAEAGKMLNRFPKRRRVAEVGQQPREHLIPLKLAFQEHAVEVEDDRVVVHSSSNNAVPMRTAVAPSITAERKSPDIPMLKPVTSWRRASLASNAK